MSERKGTKALELWCKRLVKHCPNVQIENMTTSWRNGIAFCALVHHFRPDLIDVSKLDPENVYENNQLAFSIAEKHLGIPALLDPEDMVENEVPDRLSVLTYLSQFYQRLGHTVNTKSSENESKQPSPSPTHSAAPIQFGKTGLDKCAACSLPVYLAQRLIVLHKLYHRRCFRCSKCSGHLSPKNFEVIEGSDFFCDSCKNEKTLSKFLNNNDQMGMLAFSDDLSEKPDDPVEEPISPKHRPKPRSILEKINMFESNQEKDTSITNQLEKLSLKDTSNNKHKNISTFNVSSTSEAPSAPFGRTETDSKFALEKEALNNDSESLKEKSPEKVYKSNEDKFNFLQTQLCGDIKDLDCDMDEKDVVTPQDMPMNKTEDCCRDKDEKCNDIIENDNNDSTFNVLKKESNITDDIRLAKSHNNSDTDYQVKEELEKIEEVKISVPPRKKKNINSPDKGPNTKAQRTDSKEVQQRTNKKEYPVNLNPFSDDEDEDDQPGQSVRKESTNPFGSSDEEDDEVPPIQPPPAVPGTFRNTSPVKRLIHANPFWSDDEEPTTDEETHESTSKMCNSSMATSTPNLSWSTPRRKKGKAPPPPPSIKVTEPANFVLATSMDDVASISSLSSYNSTIHSDQKSFGKSTPRSKKRLAPTPPDSLSTMSAAGSMEKVDTADRQNTPDGGRQMKRPAPGLPLPERREVKMAISSEELQVQLDLLETQQLGLERQGVLIEQMIRDKCEGDEPAASVPQEEVEDLVIQLCELVNEKNDLFRKQTELMYIRRQQRLEQEQADIEHEIRVIQSRPAVNRCDADKAREEQLVSRLVGVVLMRDELVQQMDSERRRERQEDLAIAASIASKRAQRNSDSNSSSMKSVEVVVTPKKSKVKDKVKRQFKKAKHSLIHKKKDDGEKKAKDDRPEKEKKSK